MRGRRTLALTATAVLLPASAAFAGDPIMPLSDVQAGMKCTAYSVIHGTAPDTFQAEILDVVGGEEGARILVNVSGQAVDQTGVGAGFSGSPIYCKASDGQMKNAGAISETIGDYGGKTVLATPIEQIVNTPVDPPTAQATQARRDEPFGGPDRRYAGVMAFAHPISTPITISGLSTPLFRQFAAAARKAGIALLQAPPPPVAAQPVTPLRPGSAIGVGLSNGAIGLGAIGTVAYLDGDKVWVFGHSFDDAGRRSLLMQDAYVAAIINNPVQLPESGGTYKLAGSTADIGIITNDANNAVAGHSGTLPVLTPVHVVAKDLDTGAVADATTGVADETDIGAPLGASNLSLVAPLAVTDGAAGLIDGTPLRMAGDMCVSIAFREQSKKVRVCNRYVSDGTSSSGAGSGNIVALTAGTDLSTMLSQVDAYKPTNLHITAISATINETRGQHQAYLRRITLPHTVHPGQTVTAKIKVQVVRGPVKTISARMRMPSSLHKGHRTLVFRGSEPDSGGDLFGDLTITLGDDTESDTQGPRTYSALLRALRKNQRYDGIKLASSHGAHMYRDKDLRIGGKATAAVVVKR